MRDSDSELDLVMLEYAFKIGERQLHRLLQIQSEVLEGPLVGERRRPGHRSEQCIDDMLDRQLSTTAFDLLTWRLHRT
jgi:hypothetical protein